MKSTSQNRKSLKSIQIKAETLSCLKQSLDNQEYTHDVNPNLGEIFAHIETIQNHHRKKVIRKPENNPLDIDFSVSKESSKALSSLKASLMASIIQQNLRSSTDTMKNSALSFQLNILEWFPGLQVKEEGPNKHKNINQFPINENHQKEVTINSSMPSCLFFTNSPNTETYKKEINEEEILIRSALKSFLLKQSSYIFTSFPLLSKSKHEIEQSTISPVANKENSILQETQLFYSIQACTLGLLSKSFKKNPLLNDSTIAKDISTIIGEIEFCYQSLVITLNSRQIIQTTSAINHYLVSLNRKINELEVLSNNLMSSLTKHFEEHLTNYLLVFSKVYLLLYAYKQQNISKILLTKSNYKHYINEILCLKEQQNQLTRMLGRMLGNLDKVLISYLKDKIEKDFKKDLFYIKTDLFKKTDSSLSFENIIAVLNAKKIEYANHFTNLYQMLNNILSKVNFTENWRGLVSSKDLNVNSIYTKMEWSLKTQIIVSFFDSIPIILETKKYNVNFPGIIIFTLNLLDQANKAFEQNKKDNDIENQNKFPQHKLDHYKNFLDALFSTKAEEKQSRRNSRVRVSIDVQNGVQYYPWIKKIKSSNFNQPEWIKSDIILKLIP